jgi:aminoglycoside 3'-phosphotransferase-2
MRLRVPPAWRDWIGIYRWQRRRTGLSGADVFSLEASNHPSLFVKVEPATRFSEVEAEALRLRWLGERGIACPELREFATYEGRNWLLTSALPGRDMASMPRADAAEITRIAADALRDLHARPIEGCPFDQSLARQIESVHARLDDGAIDPDDFAEDGGPKKAFAELLSMMPTNEDLVLTHGDACLPNFLVDGRHFSGFVDCGRVGIADRYRDLALTCDSIGEIMGETWVPAFLTRYGVPDPDPRHLAFYQRFDAFF